MPFMVVKDRKSKKMWAFIVKEKGVNPYAVKKLAKILSGTGYRRVILKSDQEPAVMSLKEAVKREIDIEVEVAFEESLVGEHQSNGEVENAVNRIRGQIRVTKDALETRFGKKLGREHPILPWLISHTVENINRFQVGSDGKTAHERMRGRTFRRDIAEFGERVFYIRSESVGKD